MQVRPSGDVPVVLFLSHVPQLCLEGSCHKGTRSLSSNTPFIDNPVRAGSPRHGEFSTRGVCDETPASRKSQPGTPVHGGRRFGCSGCLLQPSLGFLRATVGLMTMRGYVFMHVMCLRYGSERRRER